MPSSKKNKEETKRSHPTEKTRLHPRNRHRARYNFKHLTEICPELQAEVKVNEYGDETIDFARPNAVRLLNKALLVSSYDISTWVIPEGYLCPPIPGRADYIHYAADLLSQKNFGKIPTGDRILCLDVGIGANVIYPIIGIKEYGWSFIGSDTDTLALDAAQKTTDSNDLLQNSVDLRHQNEPEAIFKNILQVNEYVDLTICNPPFHASAEEALAVNKRKNSQLKPTEPGKSVRNFGGQPNELWCIGGEDAFVRQMITESIMFKNNCFWFTTLISKQSNMRRAHAALEKAGITEIKIIPMGQGNKTSRILAWTFLDAGQQRDWAKKRWR